MVIMDQFTRRIIGFAVNNGNISGPTLCHMFNSIISNQKLPKCISTDNDPFFKFQRWEANLRILEIEQIKSIPYTPISQEYVPYYTSLVLFVITSKLAECRRLFHFPLTGNSLGISYR